MLLVVSKMASEEGVEQRGEEKDVGVGLGLVGTKEVEGEKDDESVIIIGAEEKDSFVGWEEEKEELREIIDDREKETEVEQQEQQGVESRLGVYCSSKHRYLFSESVLKEGEEFYVVDGFVVSKIDKFKGRFFVRLKNSEEGGEVWKCVLCMRVFCKEKSKKRGKEEEDKGAGGEGEKKKLPPFKLGFFYRHLISEHKEFVREIRVEEIPKDGDCVSMLRNFFLVEEMGVDQEVMNVLELQKRKRKRKVAEKDVVEIIDVDVDAPSSSTASSASASTSSPPLKRVKLSTAAATATSSTSSATTASSQQSTAASSSSSTSAASAFVNAKVHLEKKLVKGKTLQNLKDFVERNYFDSKTAVVSFHSLLLFSLSNIPSS